jgi:hypothetical protein
MVKVYLREEKYCYLHPHRKTTEQCERCLVYYCDECLRPHKDQKLCERCYQEVTTLEAAAAERRTVRYWVRHSLLTTRNLIIGSLVLVVIVAPLAYIAYRMAQHPLTCEEFHRFAVAARGTFETNDGVNVLDFLLEGHVVWATSEDPSGKYTASRLIDGCAVEAYPGWRSADAQLPQEIVFSANNLARVDKAIIQNARSSPPESWPRRVEVLVSREGPDRGWISVGTWELAQTDEPQRLEFGRVIEGQYFMLRILSIWGNAPFVSVAEFGVYTPSRFAVPTSTAIPTQTPETRP